MPTGSENAVAEILSPVRKWLEEHTPHIAPSHVKRYVNLLHILRALADHASTADPFTLSYSRFTTYRDSHGLSRQYEPTTFIRECHSLDRWLISPACHHRSLPGLRIEADPNARVTNDPVVHLARKDIKKGLKSILMGIDPSLDDRQWLRTVVARLDKDRGMRLLNTEAMASKNSHGREGPYPGDRPQYQPQSILVTSQPVADVERWEITLLHCHWEVKGIDPSVDLTETERRFREEFNSTIAEYKSYHPGGRDIVFGYKGGSFMHPHTAVQAACRIIRAAKRFSSHERSVPCSIVVHTGLTEQASGTLRLDRASLLKEMDPIVHHQTRMGYPTQILLTRHTFLCVQGLCDCRRIAVESDLHGSIQQHEAYEVLREKCQQRAFSPEFACEVPLVGRDYELDALYHAYKDAEAGSPRCVRIRGPVGVGKSRLVEELLRMNHVPLERLLVCQCWDYRCQSPFYPLAEMLRNLRRQDRLRASQSDTTPLRKHAKESGPSSRRIAEIISQAIHAAETGRQDAVAQIEVSGRTAGDATQHCQELLGILEPIVRSLAEQEEPIVLLVEDLHWADRHTQQLLHLFLEKIRDASRPCRLLVIITYRGRPFLVDTPNDTMNLLLRLGPLEVSAAKELAGHLRQLRRLDITAEKLNELVERAEGVPEVLYERILGSDGRISWFKKVMTESENRAECSDEAKSRYVAQKAAVLGMSFTDHELAATIKGDPRAVSLSTELPRHLQYLLATGLLRTETIDGKQRYCFSYGHVRECLERSMSPRDRQEQHLIAAEALRKHVRGAKGDPETLAIHYSQAGLAATREAIDYLHRAARVDLRHSRNAEAIDKLEQALDISERAERKPSLTKRLGLRLDAARAYAALHGSSSAKVQQCYLQAKEYVEGTNDTKLMFRTRWGLWLASFIHGNLSEARRQAQDLLRHAACKTYPVARLEAHHAMWDTLFHMGAFKTALAYHFDGMAMMAVSPLNKARYDYSQFTGHHAPHVCCLSRAALTLWLSGFLDQGLDASDAAIALANELKCNNSLAHAYAYAAFTSIMARNPGDALSNAEYAVSIATTCELPQCLNMAQILNHVAEAQLDPHVEALAPLEAAMDSWKAAGIGILETFWHAQLADICRARGHVSDGLRHVALGMEAMQRTGELFYGPELHRLHGELMLAESKANYRQAQQCFQKAAELAGKSGALLLQLRALLSLNRLLVSSERNTDKKAAARRHLELTYREFTQGPDTPDLCDVKAFLAGTR